MTFFHQPPPPPVEQLRMAREFWALHPQIVTVTDEQYEELERSLDEPAPLKDGPRDALG